MQLTMLGVGSSAGTPVIGCHCPTCLSSDPRNKRTRCSALLTLASGHNILIDSGPDLRLQALREGIEQVDAVLYTHAHADHLHGIDDLRAFCQIKKQQIPLYGNQQTMQHIQQRFAYAIREPSDFWEIPVLGLNIVEQPFLLFDVLVRPVPVWHGKLGILGYRIGDLAYLTDVSALDSVAFESLRGLRILMLDCLRYTPHFSHIHLEQSLAYASQIKATNTYLMHMTHDIEYQHLSAMLPEGVQLAYDGIKLTFDAYNTAQLIST